jgi:hypothetical protein
MGPTKYRGMNRGGTAQVPPVYASNGSGGEGMIGGAVARGGLSFASAKSEIADATTGRITLGVVNLVILGMVGFYLWTRSAQGGA